jgi:transposase InsO family protein
MKLRSVPLGQQVTVTLADRRTTVATHEVLVGSLCVHGSRAACSLLVMDELSNDVIVGLNWQRAAGLTITPGHPHDLLNGQPVHSEVRKSAQASKPPSQQLVSELPVSRQRVAGEWPQDTPVRLSAALVHVSRAAAAASEECRESLSAASFDVAAVNNSQLRQVLLRHQRVFTDVLPVKTAEQIAQAKQFSIVLLGDSVRPVKQRERRLSPAEIEAATQWVREEVAAGRMEPSSSQWAAQLVIVPKRDEKGVVSGWRICGDYRNLNAVTKADAEPLPLMDTVFDQLAGMQYFSKLDLLKGFNQIPVEAKSRELMAVSTPAGLYQPTVMPFGVKNAPGSFQREMRRVLCDRLNKGVFVFIDDIIVYSRTEAEHIELIDWVLSRLEKEGYFAHPGKCQFLRDEVNFLGHVVSRAGVSMQQHKVAAIRDWPVLQSVKDVRAFLGLAGFYRRFVRGFSEIARPLTDLTCIADKKWWSWTPIEQQAFDALKHALTTAPLLAHPDPQRQWTVQTDASGHAIGGVLSQKQDDGNVKPVAFWSHKLNSAQRNYSATERELMALVEATKHWRAYLHGSPHPILLKSDHKPLVYLNGKAELGMRLSRWMEELCDLTFEIGYVKGKDNAAADALSRRSDHEASIAEPQPSTMKVRLMSVTDSRSPAKSLVSRWRVTGEWMEAPRELLAAGQTRPAQPTETQLQVDSLLSDMRAAAKRDDKYQLLLNGADQQDGLQRRDGLVYSRSGAVYVPDDRRLKTRLLELAHDAVGHFGRTKTVERLSRHCVWTGMTKEVEDYCRGCAVCAVNKSSNESPAGLLVPMPIPERVWDSVGVDFTGPLPETASGYNSIMAIVDRFSKMVRFRPCKTSITGIQAGRLLLDEMLGLGRIPTSIVSDRDVRFTGAAWGQLWRALNTEPKMSTGYHPQTDGQTERANRTLQAMLRSYAESRSDWDEWLPFVAAAYNSTVQDSTGRTPFEMNFPDARSIDPLQWATDERKRARTSDKRGVSAEAERSLVELKVIWDEVRAKLVLEQARQKKYADRKRRDVQYKVGDSVYLSTRNLRTYDGKLLAKWVGPYLVTELRGSGVSVKLDLRGELGKTNPVFHVSQLKPYEESELEWPGRQQHQRPAPELVDGETEWEVEAVVDKETRLEKKTETRLEAAPVRPSGGRVLRQRPPRQVTVTVDVPVVWYKLRWRGYDEETWQRESDCHCPELIAEYELRQRQRDEEEDVACGARKTPAVELAVATVIEWRLTDKQATSRRGKPTVRCSYASVQPLKSGPANSVAVQSAAA